jgi:hypothetical protein
MNPLSPKQILRNLENGFFMTHQEQTEAAEYIRQLQQSNEALKEGLIKNAEEMFNLRKKLANPEQEPMRWFQQFGDAPQSKEWVGLMDEERLELIAYQPHPLADRKAIINAVERLLKEKNT